MTGEEFAKICFATRPLLWAIAIIAVLLVLAFVIPWLYDRVHRKDELPAGVTISEPK